MVSPSRRKACFTIVRPSGEWMLIRARAARSVLTPVASITRSIRKKPLASFSVASRSSDLLACSISSGPPSPVRATRYAAILILSGVVASE